MMHFKTNVAVAALAAVILTALVAWQELAIARTRSDNRDRAAFLEQLRSEPDPATTPAQLDTHSPLEEWAELERLQTEAAGLRSQLQQARAARLASAATQIDRQVARRPGFISFPEARNLGSATPEAMFQTLLWAIANRDTNLVVELAAGSGNQGQVMVHNFAKDAMDAPHKGDVQFRVVRQVTLPDGDAAVVVELSRGDSLQRLAVRARRIGVQWRLVVDNNGPQEVELGPELKGD